MQKIAEEILQDLQKIRALKPIVLNLTNYVAMDFNANALLAVGASPIMAHAPDELEALTKLSQAVVLNIGTLDPLWMNSIILAATYANQYGKPLVLDPVGAGASSLRTELCLKLLRNFQITALRGNASEILSLVEKNSSSHGIDSRHRSNESLEAAFSLCNQFNCCVTISGATDYIVSKDGTWTLDNGHPMMSLVTAMGCTASSLIGAFLAVNPDSSEASRNAMLVMGICGEEASTRSQGPGSLRMNFLDKLYRLTELNPSKLKANINEIL